MTWLDLKSQLNEKKTETKKLSGEDYFSMSANLDDIQNEELIAKKIIPENIFSSNLHSKGYCEMVGW